MTAARPGGFDESERFPGFDVTARARHWDEATASVVMARLRSPEPPRYFSLEEEATADALFDLLLDQHGTGRIPVTAMVDARLAEGRTDGWRYADMPEDGEAFRRSLALLDEDAARQGDARFCDSDVATQRALLAAIQQRGSERWHDLVAAHVWSLWTRYACTAFYSHPFAWNEIGFSGPAYPRGYAALGVGKREPFEVADARPSEDPAGKDGSGGEGTVDA